MAHGTHNPQVNSVKAGSVTVGLGVRVYDGASDDYVTITATTVEKSDEGSVTIGFSDGMTHTFDTDDKLMVVV